MVLSSTPRSRAIPWRSVLRHLGPALLVAVVYYVGSLAGFALRFPSSGISFFWPPTAVLAAALMVTAPRAWLPLLAATFVAHAVAHAQNGVPVGAWPIQFLGNASQALLAAFVVRRFSGDTQLFADARRVLIFIVGACVVAPAVASLIPAYVYVSLGWAGDFFQAWRARAVTNGVASLTLLPALVVGWQRVSARPIKVPRRLGEYVLLLAGMLAAHSATALIERMDVLGLSVALYAPAPFLLWATIRFGGTGLSLALLWTTLLTVSNVAAGYGPLSGGTAADTVVGVQLLLAANAVPMMLIAGLLEQNRREHRALEDAERQTSAILRAQPDLMFVQTRDGVYLRYYARNADQLAAAPELFVGRNMRDVLPPDVAATFARAFQSVTADVPSILEYTLEIDGEVRRYEGRLIAVDDDHILSVVRDITPRWRSENALREAQQRYALATAAGGVGVWDLDPRTGRVCVEGGLKQILGYEGDEVGEQLADWLTLISATDRDDVRARLTSFMIGASASFEVECRMTHKDGSVRWVASRGAVTDRVDGLPSRVQGTYADITERKESARALMEANDALVRTGRFAAMAEVSASIAHELRQPLAAIVANASACRQSLRSGGRPVDVVAALDDVVAEARRANAIVGQTQEMFTNRPAHKSELNLNDCIRHVLDIAQARLREGNVSLELDLEPRLPRIEADVVQMQQVLLNLIVNAVEAMKGVTDRRILRIRSRRSRNAAVVSVRDTGRGFASQHARRVFEPFYTTKASGLGMGLTICRSIVRDHGGTLWAVANIDRGATFRFKLPLLDRYVERRERLSRADARY
jgi:PAS domain S-box-containing protein